jgi:RNA polymerase sigma factor (sigma-70 family)
VRADLSLTAEDVSRLYRHHARAMVSFLARRTYDPDLAIDLLAETFAAAIASRSSFRGSTDEEAVGWLYGIARNQLLGYFRRGAIERRAMQRVGIEPRALNDAEYERIEELAGLAALRGRVARELRHLSSEHRLVLELRVVQERPYPEVARAVGVSEQTVRARVSRALRALEARLDADPAAEVARHA